MNNLLGLMKFMIESSDQEHKPTEFYLEKLLNILRSHKDEDDDYRKALVGRMISTINGVEVLRANNNYLETPVLLRVTFENAARLYQYTYDKESIIKQEKKAYKILGKSPNPKFAINHIPDAKDALNMIYRFLCGFSHPDIMSLILSLEQGEGNETIIDMISKYSLIGIILIISKVYSDIEIDENELFIMSIDIGRFIIKNLRASILENQSNLPIMNELSKLGVFADANWNNALGTLSDNLNNDTNIEETIMKILLESIGSDSSVK